MFRNYFKTAWRNIRKNKLFSFINILGLSIGIALCFTIILYVQDELSYDRFSKNADHIARVIFQAQINGGKINESVSMPPVAQTMKNDFPEVQDATRILRFGTPNVRYNHITVKNDRFALVDPNFFSLFTLPFLEGDAKTALSEPNTVVVTKETAEKYFGKDEPVGKTLAVFTDSNRLYRVTGVIDNVPSNSHFHFDIFGSMTGWKDALSDSWMYGGYHTYLLLKPGTPISRVEARFPAMVEKYMGPQIRQQMGLSLQEFRTKGNSLGFKLQPLTDIHLHSDTTTEFEPGGNATYVYIFAGVAIFLLVVACINFVNLSTASASKRAKEVGVRKVIGSEKIQLVTQFLFESTLTSVIALIIAVAMLQLALPEFNRLSGKQLSLTIQPLLAFIAFGLLVGIIAGIYPAFYLSSFRPIAVLKGRLVGNNRSFSLRSALVVFQFFISVGLIIGTIVVYQQMKFIQSKDLGYNKEQLLILPNSYALGKAEQAFKQEMLQDPHIINATVSYYKPAGPTDNNNALAYPQGNSNLIVDGVDFHVDENYIPTFAMQMVSGRNFSKDFSGDSSGIILNETAAKALGWSSENAVGKVVIRENSDKGKDYPFHVIGVVKNFNFRSLHEAISPLFMTLKVEGGLIFKVKTADVAGLLAVMKKRWDRYNTGEPFTYSFMDDLYNKAYSAEQNTSATLNMFSLITIFIACLGLFGLATYTAERRIKEVGIRKVLGAGVSELAGMLSKEFIKLVFIASLIAFPVAWWAMHQWLQGFAYRINISWWVFAAAGLVALLIALITVSFQAVKVAVSNPVTSLRTE